MTKIILVTGASGMVGHSFRENIKLPWDYDFCFVGSKDCDLTDRAATFKLFKETQPDYVIHLAAKVGGVKGNTDYVADFYTKNIQMNTNVLDAAYVFNVKKVVSLLSTCVYPDSATYPLTEDQIHAGPPHKSNFGYAYAKRMLDVQSRAYRKQYGCKFITVVPNNLFGENDNFDLENSHVIPALIRKIHKAKVENKNEVVLWGTGEPLREFTYSGDIAKILLFMLERYNGVEPRNVGNTNEYSIKELANKISNILEYGGTILWDRSMPSGQHRKPSNNKKLLSLGWKTNDYTNFDEALKKTCKWYIINYPQVRGI